MKARPLLVFLRFSQLNWVSPYKELYGGGCLAHDGWLGFYLTDLLVCLTLSVDALCPH